MTPKIYRECHNELVMFPLRKARLSDRKQEIYDAGGDKSYKEMPGGTGVSSPLDGKLTQLLAYDIAEDERWIREIEDVMRTLTGNQRRFYVLHYEQGYGIVACARHMAYSDRQVNRIKADLIRKVAVRHGYIR